MRLHQINLVGTDIGSGQRLSDDPLLRRTVRRRQPIRRAVLVSRRTTHHRKHLMTATFGVREPFQQQYARALPPAGTVGAGRERLGAAVPGQAPLPAEVDEGVGGGHDSHPTGQREGALPRPQRLHRQVDRHQRRRARRVDRHGGPLQPEGVRHPAGDDAGQAAVTQVAGQLVGRLVQSQCVVVVHDAGEHARGAALERGRIDPGPLQHLPRRLQQQPLLRIHRDRLPRTDPKKVRIKIGRIVEETTLQRIRLPRLTRLRVIHTHQIPTPISRKPGNRINTTLQQLPQLLRSRHPTRKTTTHRHNRNRLLNEGGRRRLRHRHLQPGAQHGGHHELGKRRRGRIVEHQGRRQPQPGSGVEPITQLHGGQRVEAHLVEGAARLDRRCPVVAEHGGNVGADQVDGDPVPLGRGERGELPGPALRRVRRSGRLRGPPGRQWHQAAQQRRYPLRAVAQRGQVDLDRRQDRLIDAERRVEQGQILRRGEAGHAGAVDALPRGGIQPPAHPAVTGPQAPGEGDGGPTRGPAGGGQRVQRRVRCGVVALAGAVQQAGQGGEEHEHRQVRVAGQLVEVDRAVQLGLQHGVEPLRTE